MDTLRNVLQFLCMWVCVCQFVCSTFFLYIYRWTYSLYCLVYVSIKNKRLFSLFGLRLHYKYTQFNQIAFVISVQVQQKSLLVQVFAHLFYSSCLSLSLSLFVFRTKRVCFIHREKKKTKITRINRLEEIRTCEPLTNIAHTILTSTKTTCFFSSTKAIWFT